MRKLTYYVAASIDGFIADPDGRFDFFPIEPDVMALMYAERPETVPTPFRSAVGLAADEPNRSYDTVLMGRHSYTPGLEAGMTSPYDHLRQYVFSRTLTAKDPAVEIVSGDALETVRALKAEPGGLGVWLCGGGQLASQLLPEIDELVIKQYPLVLGAGIPLFADAVAPTTFALESARPFESGAVVLTYTRAL
ncbi:deaminase [Asanoa ishikariensis]|uniref:Dihydrofolate reductase n=1 Tax=Asanoa ishikariensis TaxID=137265 RepID=A0A1H3TXR9_9ACTN|nr:dihydrofolate reductase family protein [Asanoa ishikariensis]GIF67594.1 deaminase [Asanoa ishikariensis]SDZ54465.1 Dihydrofolate reductase [Asanoa ishikariensis]